MLMEEGYKLEEIAKVIIETEHARQDRSEIMEKDQRWDKIRSMLLLKRSSFDRKYGSMQKSPSKGSFGNLLKRSRSDKLPKCITVSQAA
jgi:hypothetical protein